jgi:uncharacterized damage-inducible protein DinB
MTDTVRALREQLVRALDWEEAHVGFDKAVADVPPGERGARPAGVTHSIWQLLEHLRLAQRDLIDFSVNPRYVHTLTWPDDYWPADPAPSSEAAWDESIAAFRRDREQLKQVVADARTDLTALVPTGTGQQTYLRAVMLVIDHNAYHVGQIMAVRGALRSLAR